MDYEPRIHRLPGGLLMRKLLFIFALCLPCLAQQWSGVLSSSRAIDWSQAGLAIDGFAPGALPSASWAQCVTTQCNTVSSGTTVTVASIQAAINSASAQTYVQIPAGTFSGLNGAINLKNQVAVRGAGANATFLVFSSENGCNGTYSQFCLAGSNNGPGSEQNHATWTAGFSQGATSITLSNSLNIVANSTLITLDQQDPPNDNGNIWSNASQPSGNYGANPINGTMTSGTTTTLVFCSACNFTTAGVTAGMGYYNFTRKKFMTVATVNSSTELTLEAAISSQTSGDTFGVFTNADGGSSRTDNTCSYTVSPYTGLCTQSQQLLVTACSPSCNNSGSTVLTLATPLRMPNWSSAQSTGAYWPTTTAYRMGVEDLSADLTSTTGGTDTAVLFMCYECWVSGVRSIYPARAHVLLYGASHSVVQFNYFYQSTSHSSESYAVEIDTGSSDDLILSNVCQQVTDSCPNNNGGGVGTVAAYNFAVDDVFGAAGWFQPSDYDHAAGYGFWLREGNETLAASADQVHGSHALATYFRNRYPGNQTAGCGSAGLNTCTGQTTAAIGYGATRYFNFVGNVLGQAGYHNQYFCGPGCGNQNNSVFYFGDQYGGDAGEFCANPSCSSLTTTSGDPLTGTSLMLWGNYDVVNNAVLYCTGSGTPQAGCPGDERAGTFGDTTGTPSTYVGASSPSTTFPNSFFMTATTAASCGTGLAWWKNPTSGTCPPFPPIGPDVTSGQMGRCSGGTYANSYNTAASSKSCSTGGGTLATAFGGHANPNPAAACYLNTMSGPPDGTGSVLSFNRASCYAADPATVATRVIGGGHKLGGGHSIGAATAFSSCGPPTYSCMSTSTSDISLANLTWGPNTASNSPSTCGSTNPYLFEQCGNLTGAGYTQTPVGYGNKMIRCTDMGTLGATSFWGTRDNGEPNIWDSDDSSFSAHYGNNTVLVAFSGAACAATPINYGASVDVQASHTVPHVSYSLLGLNGQQFTQNTLNETGGFVGASGWSNSTTEVTDFINSCYNGNALPATNCTANAGGPNTGNYYNCLLNPYNGMPFNPYTGASAWGTYSGGYPGAGSNKTGLFTSSADDTLFVDSFGNNAITNNVALWIVVYNPAWGANGGCDLLNTIAGTVWKHDGSCNTASPCPLTYQSYPQAPIGGGNFTITSVGTPVTTNLNVTSVSASQWYPQFGYTGTVYTGTITGGANNALLGSMFTVTGCSGTGNNISTPALAIGSTATALVLAYGSATGGTCSSGVASNTVTPYNGGTFANGGSGAFTNYSFVVSAGPGACSGTFIAANSSTSVLTLNTNCSAGTSGTASGTQVGPDKFVMHEAFKSPDDSIVVYDASAQSYMWNGVWAEGLETWAEGTTTNYAKCGLLSPSTQYCTGHPISGYTGIVSGNIFSSPYSTLNTVQNLFGSGLNPCSDTHMSWNDTHPGDSYPFMLDVQDEGGTYFMLGGQSLGGGSAPPCPYYNELDFVQVNGTLPGNTFRVAPTMGTGWHPNFEVQNSIGLQSSSGKYIAWVTDGLGQFGSTSNTASCNIGGPDWQSSSSGTFTAYSGSGPGVFGNFIAPPTTQNAGHYVFAVQSCSGSPCTTGSAHPIFPQSPSATVAETGTGNITWVNTGNIQNCRSDLMVVKTF